MTDSFNSLLIGGASELNIAVSDEQAEKLFDFYQTVLEYNKKVNLTSITDEKEFVIKHIIDSVSSDEFIEENASVCDIGAGAGFPSIPLKIIRPDVSFTLFDALKKRVDFLEFAINRLGLKNISAVHIRAEDGGRYSYRDTFDITVARAVGSTSTLLEYSVPLIKNGGLFINYKGADLSDAVSASSAEKTLGVKKIKVKHFFLPQNLGERNIVVYKKIAYTNSKYPRSSSLIKKSPL